jgi:hypothetical protein
MFYERHSFILMGKFLRNWYTVTLHDRLLWVESDQGNKIRLPQLNESLLIGCTILATYSVIYTKFNLNFLIKTGYMASNIDLIMICKFIWAIFWIWNKRKIIFGSMQWCNVICMCDKWTSVWPFWNYFGRKLSYLNETQNGQMPQRHNWCWCIGCPQPIQADMFK